MKLEPYNGGKSGAGVYQTIINQQPPHTCYVEPFLGHGGVMRKKRPANVNIGLDVDQAVIDTWISKGAPEWLSLMQADALMWLLVSDDFMDKRSLIYVDPPYVQSSRKSDRPLYGHELTDNDHIRLLDTLKSLPCMIQISGYPSELYANALRGWRRIEFQAQTRQGTATEMLWMNYPEPEELHTTWYVGKDYRERERIKKKRERWVKRFAEMKPQERQVIAEALEHVRGTTSP